MKKLTAQALDRIESKFMRMLLGKCKCCRDVAERGTTCGDCSKTIRLIDPRPLVAEIRRLNGLLRREELREMARREAARIPS